MANGQYMLSLPGHSDNVKFKKNCYLPYIININTQIKHVLKTIKFVKIVIRNYLQNKSLNGEFEFLFFCFFYSGGIKMELYAIAKIGQCQILNWNHVFLIVVDMFWWVLYKCLASVIRAGEEHSESARNNICAKAAALSRKQA